MSTPSKLDVDAGGNDHLRKSLSLGKGHTSTKSYEQSDAYDRFFKDATNEEVRCPDLQQLTIPDISGITFTFGSVSRNTKSATGSETTKSNRDVVVDFYKDGIAKNASSRIPNGYVNFFFALTDAVEDLTLNNSVGLWDDHDEKPPLLDCCVGYKPGPGPASKRDLMFKMSAKDSRRVEELLGMRKIMFYIFCAKEVDESIDPIQINLLIVTRAQIRKLNGMVTLKDLLRSLKTELENQVKKMDHPSREKATKALDELFGATSSDGLKERAGVEPLSSLRNLINSYASVAATVFMKKSPAIAQERPLAPLPSPLPPPAFSPKQPIPRKRIVLDWVPKVSEIERKQSSLVNRMKGSGTYNPVDLERDIKEIQTQLKDVATYIDILGRKEVEEILLRTGPGGTSEKNKYEIYLSTKLEKLNEMRETLEVMLKGMKNTK
jgi:hypothetical protein